MRARPSRRTQLLAVLRKETLQTVRDKRQMMMLIGAPLLQLLVFGYVVNFKLDRLPTVVVDQDRSAGSREHLRRLVADQTLLLRGHADTLDEAERGLRTGQTSAVVVLPPGFAHDVERGETAEVQVIIDGGDPNRSTLAAATALRYFTQAGREILRGRLASRGVNEVSTPGLELRSRIAFNPTLDSPPFMIPGIMALLLIIVTSIVTAMGLSREREMGTLEQVLVTPIRPSVLLLGKMLPFVVIGCFDVVLALTMGTWLFEVPLRGSLLVVAVATVFYLMTTLAAGLLISTVSRTQQQAFLGAVLFMLPAILLSGVMTPILAMPWWLRAFTYLNPVRYFAEILRANLLAGAGFDLLWPRLAILALFGLTLLTVATLRFRKRVS
jgi:ABC-2 type transport system permease protein